MMVPVLADPRFWGWLAIALATGVLLALPASAALLVALRHLKAAYLAGPLYGGPNQ